MESPHVAATLAAALIAKPASGVATAQQAVDLYLDCLHKLQEAQYKQQKSQFNSRR